MTKIRAFIFVMSFMLLPSIALADRIVGSVISVDPTGGKLMVKRTDTQKVVTVVVKDRSGVRAVRTNDTVDLNAERMPQGVWEVDAVYHR